MWNEFFARSISFMNKSVDVTIGDAQGNFSLIFSLFYLIIISGPIFHWPSELLFVLNSLTLIDDRSISTSFLETTVVVWGGGSGVGYESVTVGWGGVEGLRCFS